MLLNHPPGACEGVRCYRRSKGEGVAFNCETVDTRSLQERPVHSYFRAVSLKPQVGVATPLDHRTDQEASRLGTLRRQLGAVEHLIANGWGELEGDVGCVRERMATPTHWKLRRTRGC